MARESVETVVVGNRSVRIEEIVELAKGTARIALPSDERWRESISAGFEFLHRQLEDGAVVYGVNTGYGDSFRRAVPAHLVAELPLNLTRYHGCGLGRDLDAEASAAVLAARITSLALGRSGVRMVLLERLCALLDRRVLPVIPEEGSVGASGDLTPLSYVAAVLVGEREVLFEGRRMPAAEALARAGIEPIELAPKEALAIMNGTAAMTGLACLAYARAQHLLELSASITALCAFALRANRQHFDARLFELKPHRGQMEVAGWIRAGLEDPRRPGPPPAEHLQDPYSVRCAPHVLGVLADTLPFVRGLVETELNSANDNPLIFAEDEAVLHGGNFYGGHVAIAMDTLKVAVSSVADLLDRQFALLVDQRTNRGLPSNLSGAPTERASVHHGFKAVQIASSAWTAEALKASMPATLFSRSTECHNQDKVSMGTIAARDALRVLELSEQVVAAMLLASVQAVELRLALDPALPRARILGLCESVRAEFPPLVLDRPLDATLRLVLERIRAGRWSNRELAR